MIHKAYQLLYKDHPVQLFTRKISVDRIIEKRTGKVYTIGNIVLFKDCPAPQLVEDTDLYTFEIDKHTTQNLSDADIKKELLFAITWGSCK